MKTVFLLLALLLSSLVAKAQSVPDSTKWFTMNEFGRTSNSELECYVPSQDTLNSSDYLVLTAIVQNTTCTNSYGSGTLSSSYASGELESKASWTYGTFEYTAKMPGGTGTWPAIWLLGKGLQPTTNNGGYKASCAWPQAGCNEIDMTEVSSSALTQPYQNSFATSGSESTCRPTISNVAQNFHVYRFIWSSSSLIWQVDGVTTCTFTSSAVIPSTPMFAILNIAIGGNLGGTVNNSTLPQSMIVENFDYCTSTSVTVDCNPSNATWDGGFGVAAGPSTVPPTAPGNLTLSVN